MHNDAPDLQTLARRESTAWIIVSTDALMYLDRLIAGESLDSLMKEAKDKTSFGGQLALRHIHRKLDAL